MATTQVILLQPVEALGGEGEQVEVRAGYARNYLLPQGIAMPVTRANRKQIEVLNKRREEREAKERAEAEDIVSKLDKLHLAIAVKTGEGGKMYGSVNNQDLQKRLAEEGIELERKHIDIPDGPVKELGRHTARIKVHADITHELEFEVVSENPIETEETEEPAEAGAKR